MSETPAGFTPPEPMPVVARAPAAPAAPPVGPPVTAWGPPPQPLEQHWAPPAPRPPRTPMRTRTLIAIVGGVVVALTGLSVLAVSGGALIATSVTNATTGPPLMEGEPGSPVAVERTVCDDQCFTDSSIHLVIPLQAEFRHFGLPVQVDRFGDFESTSAEADFGVTAVEWARAKLNPAECFFTFYGTPNASPLDERPAQSDTDVIEYAGTHSTDSESTFLWQSVRLFDSSQSAEDHMRALDDQSRECDGFSGKETTPTQVTPAPALKLPDSVSAIGWVQSSPLTRYYVYDVQRGNLVVRSILWTYADEFSEQQFHDFVETLAVDLAAVEIPAPDGE